jgi:8-oxo-dGTP pyrophosphatase MutT (NUDIX family)
MAISEYLRRMRTKVGHDSILMPGVTAVVFNQAGQVLLHQSTDNSHWYVIGGAMDPNEEPAETVIREVLEETGITVTVDQILSVTTQRNICYPNGDVVDYVAINFLCHATDNRAPHPNDDESLAVAYFSVDSLPPLTMSDQERIARALQRDPRAHFLTASAAN